MLAGLLAVGGSVRSAQAGYVWEWLFGNRNHAYYAGHQPQVPGQPAALASYASAGTPTPAGPQTAQAGWTDGAPAMAPGAWPANGAPTTTAYPPAAGYAPSTGYAAGSPAPPNSPPQQLANPWVIIPSSSAPISGQPSPASVPAGSAAGGFASGSVVSGYAPAAGNVAGTSSSANVGGQPVQQAWSVPAQQAGSGPMVQHQSWSVPAHQTMSVPTVPQQVWSVPAQATVAVQPQQTFMVQPATPTTSQGGCWPWSSRSTSNYRTVWYRVPTTNVRPVAAVDPCTGATTTVMRPCTTFSWQARRVPTMRTPSLCERLFSCFRRPPPPPVTPMAVTTGYACGPACAPVAAGTTMPYYAPPATTSVGTPNGLYGGTALPATSPPASTFVSPPGTTFGGGAPGTAAPATAAPAPAGGVPADYPPSLAPRRYPPEEPSESAPADDANAPDNADEQGLDSSASYPAAGTRRVPLSSPQLGSPNASSTLATDRGTSEPRRLEPQPVPDPDALLNSPRNFDPPRLLNPKDRRASQVDQPAGAFVLVSWSETSPQTAVRSRNASAPITPPRSAPREKPETASQGRPAEDTGWRSSAR
jgi:hypothetical protein